MVPGTELWVDLVPSETEADYVVINLSSNFVPTDWSSQLAGLDAHVVAAYPPRAFVVRIPSENKPFLPSLPLVRWAGDYLPGYRLPPEVMLQGCPPGADYLDLWLVLFHGEDPDVYLPELATLVPGILIGDVFESGPSTPWSSATIAVSIPWETLPGALQNLAGLESLELMDLRLPATPANDAKLTWLQSGVDQDPDPGPPAIPPYDLDTYAPAFRVGITGKGETVAVADSGLDNDMCFFRWGAGQAATTQGQYLPPPCLPGDGPPCPPAVAVNASKKVVAYYWHHFDTRYDSGCATTPFHGTHVAGTVAGDTFDDAAGVANYFLATLDDPSTENEPLPPPPRNVPFGFSVDHHQAGDGMAPGAQLLIQDLRDETGSGPACTYVGASLPIAARHHQAYFSTDAAGLISVRHHNDSWGFHASPLVPAGYSYTPTARDGDAFSWTHRDFNVYFCAGNEGDPDGDDLKQPSRIRDPAQMKNCVTVGSSGNPDVRSPSYGLRMADSSSHGPAFGVRIKPDLSAPGHATNSATPQFESPETGQPPAFPTGNYDCSRANASGTSMATPAVSGLSALLRQYIREGRYPDGETTHPELGFSPSSALIKALLVNATRSVWNGQPLRGEDTADFGIAPKHRPTVGQGWGRPVLDDVIDFGTTDTQSAEDPLTHERERSNMFILTDTPNGLLTTTPNDGRPLAIETLSPAIQPGQVHEFEFLVTDTDEPLHITLAWTDWKGDTNARVPLVNDLDLEVIDPLGRVWRPEPGAPGADDTGGTPPGYGYPFGYWPGLWADGFSVLEFLESMTPQNDGPPFYDFAGRDERNNLENVFVRPYDPADPTDGNAVVVGAWKVRVIYYESAVLPGASTVQVFPDLVDPDAIPCVDVAGHPCDWADTRNQGYALVVSGAIRKGEPEPFPGLTIISDGCEDTDGLRDLDLNEVVNLHVPLTTEVTRHDVIGCLSALPGGPSEGKVKIGGFAPDIGPGFETTCAVFGDMPPLSTSAARFTIRLYGTHPPADARFRLEVWAGILGPGGVYEPCAGLELIGDYDLSVPHTMDVLAGFNPTPGQPAKGGCAAPPDPKYTWVHGDADGLPDDLFIEFCAGDPLHPPADNYNIYRGSLWDCPQEQWDHVSRVPAASWCNVACNDGGFPGVVDALGNPMSFADNRCEALLLNQASAFIESPHYWISGEADCLYAGEGAEGAFPACTACLETPYGGGVCP